MITGLRETANSPGRRISMESFFSKFSPTRQSNLSYGGPITMNTTPRYVNFRPEQPSATVQSPVYVNPGPQQQVPSAQSQRNYVINPQPANYEASFSPIRYQAVPNFGPRNFRGADAPTVPQQPQEHESLALEGNLPVRLKLGNVTAQYDKGQWSIDGSQMTTAKVESLKEQNRKLEAENEILKFKITYLLDLLATTKLDALQLQGEKSSLEVNSNVQ